MEIALLGVLAGLALIDSTSFGTLLIPVWMMMSPAGLRAKRLLIFLGTVAGAYFLLGIALSAGATVFIEQLSDALDSKPAYAVQLALGIGLLLFGIFSGRKKSGAEKETGRLMRWRERAMSGEGSPKSLMLLAVAAVGLEAATMVPYLAAIGLLSKSSLAFPQITLVLAGYCLVMILPALALLVGRMTARKYVEPVLEKINQWMVRNAAETTAWIVGIIGFLLIRDATSHLF
ncbi:MAG: GAP family protein [Corynebacteriales bacterium]|nr:GAP family protein [Mycobacteriales bacterium]